MSYTLINNIEDLKFQLESLLDQHVLDINKKLKTIDKNNKQELLELKEHIENLSKLINKAKDTINVGHIIISYNHFCLCLIDMMIIK